MTDLHENGKGATLGGAQEQISQLRDSAQEQINQVRDSAQAMMSSPQAREALDRLRGLLDQASQALRDFGQQSGQWTQVAQTRASEMARQFRDQGGVAVDSVSRQVEQNPLTSIGIAFAIGFLFAALIRR